MVRWQELKELLEVVELEVVQRPMGDALKRFLDGVLEVERAVELDASRDRRSMRRSGQRFGVCERVVLSAFGMVRGLFGARVREGGVRSKVLERCRRRWMWVEIYIR